MAILAVDYGERRIGLAVSDEMGVAAHGLPTLHCAGGAEGVEQVCRIARERGVEEVVVGLPRNMDGSEGAQAGAARAFGAQLREMLKAPVRFVDERLSSSRAERVLSESGVSLAKRKGMVDRMAAQFILEHYLSLRRSMGPEGAARFLDIGEDEA
ncbi:MAG TPA: Holliday junction resolvase RuvX [Candidatus Brocadiia bacterium]|nr:Holliday junction resolvase RuvX [Candidatus Brocadiia bacterium]